MPAPVVLDAFQVELLLPAGADEGISAASRAALDDPAFLDAVQRAIQTVLDATPLLAMLSVRAAW